MHNVKMDIQMLNFICEKFKHTFEWAIQKEWLKLRQMVVPKRGDLWFYVKSSNQTVQKNPMVETINNSFYL